MNRRDGLMNYYFFLGCTHLNVSGLVVCKKAALGAFLFSSNLRRYYNNGCDRRCRLRSINQPSQIRNIQMWDVFGLVKIDYKNYSYLLTSEPFSVVFYKHLPNHKLYFHFFCSFMSRIRLICKKINERKLITIRK